MLGHPLGTQAFGLAPDGSSPSGISTRSRSCLIDLLGAEGASGSPIVDDGGHVVGVLQAAFGGKDYFGQRTAGAIVGIDLASWWLSGHRVTLTLCRAYPHGGISGCPGSQLARPASPSRPVNQPPAAPVPPSAASWGPPPGFKYWAGAGVFVPGTVAWEFANCSRVYPTSASCWGVDVATKSGCPARGVCAGRDPRQQRHRNRRRN